MTLRYSEMNQHDALYRVARAYPGGVEALAQRMGKSANVLYNKLRPGIDSHNVTFEEASEIVELCVQAGVKDAVQPLHAQNWRHGMVAFSIPCSQHLSDDDLVKTVYRVMKETGDVAESVSTALADGVITQQELQDIENRFQHMLSAIGEWRERIRSRSEAK